MLKYYNRDLEFGKHYSRIESRLTVNLRTVRGDMKNLRHGFTPNVRFTPRIPARIL
jgi:hypothetical protein